MNEQIDEQAFWQKKKLYRTELELDLDSHWLLVESFDVYVEFLVMYKRCKAQ